jgi:peptidoglycan hydrolase-like protein with peptidoglycan-binding domain
LPPSDIPVHPLSGTQVEASQADNQDIPLSQGVTLSSRRLASLLLLSTALTALAVTGASASTTPTAGSHLHGADISWPNCPTGMGIPERRTQGNPMPTSDAAFVVLGLTNGPGFYPNPCLKDQVSWAKARHLWTGAYSIVSFPTAVQLKKHGGSGTVAQRLARVGAAQASYNLSNMRKAGLAAPFVWIDVEPVKGWSWSIVANNNAFLDGVLAGYKTGNVRTGIYSYAYGWKEITGGRSLPGLPTWVPSGKDTMTAAAAKCGTKSFSGGPVWIGQSTVGGRDIDITCTGVTGSAGGQRELTRYESTRLSIGSTGPTVAVLQRHLGVTADGKFGRQTKAKVVAFQKAKRLKQNGIVDRPVWRALGVGTTSKGAPSLMRTLFVST